MILGIDVGGTKTLLGVFNDGGEIIETRKFPTPKEYKDFLKTLKGESEELRNHDFGQVSVAVPGRLNSQGVALAFGNLDWHNIPIRDDLTKLFGLPVVVENDAKTGALAEASNFDKDKSVLYVTVGTGIGTGLVVGGRLDGGLIDSEGGQIMLKRGQELVTWESIASGKAITKRYGKEAREITDQKSWQEIAANLGIGIIDLCAVLQPDVVVIGGGVGNHFSKFESYLNDFVKSNKNDLIKMPEIVAAREAELAALKGCFINAKQHSS